MLDVDHQKHPKDSELELFIIPLDPPNGHRELMQKGPSPKGSCFEYQAVKEVKNANLICSSHSVGNGSKPQCTPVTLKTRIFFTVVWPKRSDLLVCSLLTQKWPLELGNVDQEVVIALLCIPQPGLPPTGRFGWKDKLRCFF